MKKLFIISICMLLLIPIALATYGMQAYKPLPDVFNSTTKTSYENNCGCALAAMCAVDGSFATCSNGASGGITNYTATYNLPQAYNYSSIIFNQTIFGGTQANITVPPWCYNQTTQPYLYLLVQESAGSSGGMQFYCQNYTTPGIYWPTPFYTQSGTGSGYLYEMPLWINYNLNMSLNITFYDEKTLSVLTVPTSFAIVTSLLSNISQVFYTNNGLINVANMPASNVSIIGGTTTYNYASRQLYYYNQPINQTQNVAMYLSNSTASTTFTVQNQYTASILQDVFYQIYGSSSQGLNAVQSGYTDVTGKFSFQYTPSIKYTIVLQKTGFQDTSFILNPILFSDYTVKMYPTTTINQTLDLNGIVLFWSPNYFYNNMNNQTFSFTIANPFNDLISYGYNISYGNVWSNSTGTNPSGSTLTSNISIVGAAVGDSVTFNYWYYRLSSGYRTYTWNLGIYTNTTSTTMTTGDKTYGLGIFERSLIIVIIGILIVGIASLIGRPLSGLVIAFFTWSYFAYIGFIPFWSIAISAVVGIILIMNREEY